MKNIGDNSITNCKELKTVSIPKSIEVIGYHAFDGCTGLTSITVHSDNLKFASENGVLFNKSKSILIMYPDDKTGTYTIPNGVREIGEIAFKDCTGINTIMIPYALSKIGERAFCNCTNMTAINVAENSIYFYSEDGVLYNKNKTTLLAYPTGKQGGYTVLSYADIANYAFYNCSGLTGISMHPNKIGNYAFFQCDNLTSLKLSSVDEIGYDAFFKCSGLITLELSWIGTISTNAFYSCTQLTTAKISYSDIGPAVFAGCTCLSTLDIDGGTIGNSAFSGCIGLTSLTIDSRMIGNEAFSSCTNLRTVNLGSSVYNMASTAFFGCGNLEHITCDEKNPYYKSIDGVLYDHGVRSLVTYPGAKEGAYSIPQTVNWIYKGAYTGGYGLTSLVIPSSVEYIYDYAFLNALGLTTILINPNNYLRCESHSFNSDFKDVDGNPMDWSKKGIAGYLYVKGENARTSSTWNIGPSGSDAVVATIDYQKGTMTINGTGTFELPDDRGSIGEGLPLGTGRDAAKTITITNKQNAGELNIPDKIFLLDGKIVNLTIDGNVTIGESSFASCPYLSSVHIISCTGPIGERAFSNCSRLNIINIGSNVEEIGDYSFSGCTNILRLEIGIGLKTIGNGAFQGCTSLVVLAMGNTLTTIGDNAFNGCNNLKSLNIGDSVQTIGNDAFNGCVRLETLVLGKGLRSIGNNAFYNCYNLKSMNIPDNVGNIGDLAFARCNGLTKITFGDMGGTTVGVNVFGTQYGTQFVFLDHKGNEFPFDNDNKSKFDDKTFNSIGNEKFMLDGEMEVSVEIVPDVSAGTVNVSGTKYYGDKVTLTATPLTFYAFVKWIVNGIEMEGSEIELTMTKDTNVSAVFKKVKVTVTFDGNGGTVSQYAQTYVIGERYGTLPTASRAGYNFENWTTNEGVIITPDTIVGEDVTTLKAKWVENPSPTPSNQDFTTIAVLIVSLIAIFGAIGFFYVRRK